MKLTKKLFIVVIVVACIIAALYAYFIVGNQMREMRGLQKGNKYAEKMYSDYDVVGENCQGEDSNDDGYVTCNFRLKKQNSDEEKTITLQCPTFVKSFMATSCKEQGIMINNQ